MVVVMFPVVMVMPLDLLGLAFEPFESGTLNQWTNFVEALLVVFVHPLDLLLGEQIEIHQLGLHRDLRTVRSGI
jgi:hypothetical protein